MEERGESLNNPILPYPGRQLLPGTKSAFFGLKSGIKGRYIYDLGLSTGEILYEGAGGMGITTESHVLRLHDLMRMPYAESLILEEYDRHFKGKWGPRKFYRLRRDVNEELKNPSRRTIAKLYCLLACSGFRHKFDRYGNFKGEYFPHTLDISSLQITNKKLTNSDFILNKCSLAKFDKNLLTKKSLVHLHLPFPSSSTYKDVIFNYFDKINKKGFDILVTGRYSNRGLVDTDLSKWSKKYSSAVIPQFKEESSFLSSDIFIFNF